jgi:hypothetical protein
MLSTLAIGAATLVTLSSDALARSGGFSGMRSFAVARSTPIVVTRVRTTSTATVRRQTFSAATKLKKFQVSDKLKNNQVKDKLKNAKLGNKSPHTDPCTTQNVAGAATCPTGGTGGTGGTTTGNRPPVIVVAPQPVYSPASLTVAPVAVDPPGCVYERSVRKLPGGGLQHRQDLPGRLIVSSGPYARTYIGAAFSGGSNFFERAPPETNITESSSL